jgi:hypothetical protein
VDRKVEFARISSPDQIPSIHEIRTYARDIELRIIFHTSIKDRCEPIGAYLKKKLPGFLVRVLVADPIIIITRIISEDEVIAHQAFFEQCAIDYRNLATQLIHQLALQFGITIDPASPLNSFYPLMKKQSAGTMEQWDYGLHGFHCRFEHKLTHQSIEVSLIYGLEFGDLDPYFFTHYILSTPAYHPLPVAIYDEFHDGVQINNTMLSLGKFEQIPSILNGRSGIAVTNREKISLPERKAEDIYPRHKPAFNLFKFLKGKK